MADEDVDDGWRSGPAAPTKDAAFSSDTDDDDCDGDGDGDDEHGSDRDTLAVPASEKDPDVVALYKARAREPEKYSAHEALVAALRQQPDRAGQLRAAREEFARSFALPPLLWRQWIRDEAKDLDPDSDSSTREVVRQLCERALSDYADVPIWTTYLELITGVSPCVDSDESDEEDEEEDEEDDDGDQNDETSRGLFQRAIAAVGAHYALGQRPWRMYRAFERQLWSRAKRRKLPQNEVFLCAGRVFKTYRDQLTVPLKGNERALESMRRFVAASDIEQLQAQAAELNDLHGQALKLRLQCEAHEVALATTASALLTPEGPAASERKERRKTHEDAWLSYISWLQTTGNVPLILCVLERGVAVCRHTGSKLWLNYCTFAAQQLRDSPLALRISKRGLRNCPWEVDLHLVHIRALERTGSDPKTIDEAKEAALRSPLCGGPEAYRDVLLAFCDFCRRELAEAWHRTSPDVDKCVKFVQLLRGGFMYGLAFLQQTYPKWSSGRIPLYTYYANVEENLMGDISGEDTGSANARRIWEECVETAGSAETMPWISYAQFECRQQDPDAERAIFRKAVQVVPSDHPRWDDVCDAWLMMERERGSIDDFELALTRISSARLERSKRTVARALREASGIAGRSISDVPTEDSLSATAKRPAKTNPDYLSSAAPKKRPRISEDGFNKTKKNPPMAASGAPVEWPMHPLTVYVKGFSSDQTEEFLTETFTTCGTITAVRILRDKRTKLPRGEGMVQFASASSVESALALSVGTMVIAPSRFPASTTDPAAPQKKKKKGKPDPPRPQSNNPYLNHLVAADKAVKAGAANESESQLPKPKPNFSFLPRSVKKRSTGQ
jgi:hypothetical protein